MADENGMAVCGEDFCDCCGDCIACYGSSCVDHGCPRCTPREDWDDDGQD